MPSTTRGGAAWKLNAEIFYTLKEAQIPDKALSAVIQYSKASQFLGL